MFRTADQGRLLPDYRDSFREIARNNFAFPNYLNMYRKLDDLWKQSKKAGLTINSSKTEEIRVNTTVNQGLRLNGEDIKRLSDFCYLGSIVTENGGTSKEINTRIQKARGSFSKLKKVWLSKLLRKDKKLGYLMPV
jgi:hypothetical protein